MGKRLHMTGADYLAIAISPALIMTLVGSLVFFLIEVSYVGQYQARLNYVFALFVFAAVLVARISIEMGADRAALYGTPLAIAVFVVLQKFVEHPSPLSPLVNLLLIAVVWWCAHKLTWDCTLIDDSEDSSGEGLMQRLGADEPARPGESAVHGAETQGEQTEQRPAWWRRLFQPKSGPHSPGLWVLYFSLAALPLFGLGQQLINAADTGRRRYVFVLLLIYVASGLSLLVTTSFLGLRRYLRQRQLEMPAPMAATWVTFGAALIAIVMLLAALLPRPHAEYAISQPPWRMQSPANVDPSRYGAGSDGPRDEESGRPVSLEEEGAAPADGREGEQTAGSEESSDASSRSPEGGEPTRSDSPSDSGELGSESGSSSRPEGESTDQGGGDAERLESEAGSLDMSEQGDTTSGEPMPPTTADEDAAQERREESQEPGGASRPASTDEYDPGQLMRQASAMIGGLFGFLKWLFYGVIAAVVLYLGWRHRQELLNALMDILAAVRKLFGAGDPHGDEAAEEAQPVRPPRRRFREFRSPFAGDGARRMAPEELVRYSFEAFEAWSADRGAPRSLDQTPQEFARTAVRPDEAIFAESRRLAALYSRLAYGDGVVALPEAMELQSLWREMEQGARHPAAGPV